MKALVYFINKNEYGKLDSFCLLTGNGPWIYLLDFANIDRKRVPDSFMV
jgi:hypothetical protein